MKTYWKIKDETGDYVDVNGVRYQVYGALDVYLPDGMPNVKRQTLFEAIAALGISMITPVGWVDKRAFIKAIKALIPDDQLQAVASNWQTVFTIAQLPGEMVDTSDVDLIAFIRGVNLTMADVLAAME